METYTNYYDTHNYSLLGTNFERKDKYYDMNIGKFFKALPKDSLIVDIGCGQGKFAYFCKKRGFTNYVGFDLDKDIVAQCKKDFPQFSFSSENCNTFLSKNQSNVSIVFMSHVFEHLDLSEGAKLIRNISHSLGEGGKWLNIMPNASHIFLGTHARYCDITHRQLYTTNSFNQLLLNNGFKREKITHMNHRLGNTFVKKLIHTISFFFQRLILLSIGMREIKVYTFEIVSILEK